MFTANFVMSTLAPDDMAETDNPIRNMTKIHNHQETDATATNLTLRLSDVIDLDRDDDDMRNPPILTRSTVPKPTTEASPERKRKVVRNKSNVNGIPAAPVTVTLSQDDPTSSALHTEKVIPRRSEFTTFTTTLAATVTNTLHKQNDLRDRSHSPNGQAINTAGMLDKQTESEEICVTFRDESQTANDEEMEIPASPQPERRRRLKLFSRLFQSTQYAEDLSGRVLAENSDYEN